MYLPCADYTMRDMPEEDFGLRAGLPQPRCESAVFRSWHKAIIFDCGLTATILCDRQSHSYTAPISRPDVDVLDDEGNVILKRYAKMGPEKNNRKDPIVELGLLMDQTRIPIAFTVFPGNESEKVHTLPVVNRVRTQYGIGRMIVVADRGLNTSDNIYMLNGKNDRDDNPRDGYVYGQSVRGADAEFKAWVLDQKGYVDTPLKDIDPDFDENDSSKDAVFRHKSRIYPKKIYIKREKSDGKVSKQTITVDQKQMV